MVTSSTSRDPDATRARILAAVGAMIVRDGLASVGVNALAREAGCDKVLIYRYFGDLEGVYAAFAAQGEFWWTVEDLVRDISPATSSLPQAMKTIFRRHARALRGGPVTLAVLAAELTIRTPLVVALEKVRERRSLELSTWIEARYRLPPATDLQAITMLVGVAINYLAARSRTIAKMSGVDIAAEEGWERIFAAIDAMIDALTRET